MGEPNNIIRIEFFDKRNFPKGVWVQEPDLCFWYCHGLPCLVIRDMSMGIWKGFVGLGPNHVLYEKDLEHILGIPQALELYRIAYGGIARVGKLASKYQGYAKNCWWIGIETTQGNDLMPFLKLEVEGVDNLISDQTYKDLHFIRRETNKLSKYLSTLK